MQRRRDPAIAAPWERLAACILDWIIIVASVARRVLDPAGPHQARARRHHHLARARPPPSRAGGADNVARNPANQHTLLYLFLAMFGIALAYYWVQHAAWGATIGKRALGVRVVQASRPVADRRQGAGIRTVAFLVGPAAFLLLAAPLNVAGGPLWAADTGRR